MENSLQNGIKIQSLKRNPNVYFLVDVVDRGVRGKGMAKVIDDSEYAIKILSRNLVRYMGSLDSPEAMDRIELAKKNYSAIEISPLFMATWRAY